MTVWEGLAVCLEGIDCLYRRGWLSVWEGLAVCLGMAGCLSGRGWLSVWEGLAACLGGVGVDLSDTFAGASVCFLPRDPVSAPYGLTQP